MPDGLTRDQLVGFQTAVGAIIREAGDIALGFARDGAKRWVKGDTSIVTEADIRVDGFLRERLTDLDRDIGWLSEETVDTPDRLDRDKIWIVDPIDGTRAFVEGVPVWVISIALVEAGRPTLGIIYNPTRDELFTAIANDGAYLNGHVIRASERPSLTGAEIVGPRSMIEDLATVGIQVTRAPYVYALAYRMANVAARRVDAAVASTRSKDWDIAAADLILHESGGRLVELDGSTPSYNLPAPVHQPLIGATEPLNASIRAALSRAAERPQTWA